MDTNMNNIEIQLKDIDKRLKVIEIWLLQFLEDRQEHARKHADLLERCKSEPTIKRK
jgi:hypothetical protein